MYHRYIKPRAITVAMLSRDTVAGWWEDKAPRFGAALAYYSILSLAPLLILVTPIANWLFGEKLVRGEIMQQFGSLVGDQGSKVIDMMMEVAFRPSPTPIATALSIGVLLFAASAVFAQLQDALNTIWEVAPKPGKAAILTFLRQRFLSFAMVVVMLFLLLVSLMITTTLELLRRYIDTRVAGLFYLWTTINVVVSYLVITLLFAMIYKILPDATIRWRDVWIGAAITSVLFSAGKFGIGLYLGHRSFGSYYGAAGSVVALLVWVYFSSQILFLGAEFTHSYAKLRGEKIRARENAVPMTREARAQQGIPHKKDVERVAHAIEEREAGNAQDDDRNANS